MQFKLIGLTQEQQNEFVDTFFMALRNRARECGTFFGHHYAGVENIFKLGRNYYKIDYQEQNHCFVIVEQVIISPIDPFFQAVWADEYEIFVEYYHTNGFDVSFDRQLEASLAGRNFFNHVYSRFYERTIRIMNCLVDVEEVIDWAKEGF